MYHLLDVTNVACSIAGLVVITTVAGYVLAPAPLQIQSLMCAVIGTGLMSSAANSINQFLEVPFDAQMSRTKSRVLVLQGLRLVTFQL
jgi:protoheme IX farnesyltransferase